MKLQSYTYAQLTVDQVYDLLQLRQHVFIQEQQSIYDDIDGLDKDSVHVLMKENNKLYGYLRFRSVDSTVIFERVVLSQQARGAGQGNTLFQYGLSEAHRFYNPLKYRLSAQLEVVEFYIKFGFSTVSQPYDDGGILHVTMEKQV